MHSLSECVSPLIHSETFRGIVEGKPDLSTRSYVFDAGAISLCYAGSEAIRPYFLRVFSGKATNQLLTMSSPSPSSRPSFLQTNSISASATLDSDTLSEPDHILLKMQSADLNLGSVPFRNANVTSFSTRGMTVTYALGFPSRLQLQPVSSVV